MLCMRALVKHDYGFRKIVTEDGLLGRIALSIQVGTLCARMHKCIFVCM